jgi:hypothetical protein
MLLKLRAGIETRRVDIVYSKSQGKNTARQQHKNSSAGRRSPHFLESRLLPASNLRCMMQCDNFRRNPLHSCGLNWEKK